MRLSAKWGGVLVVVAGIVLLWFFFAAGDAKKHSTRVALPLDSYRQQFARPDGSLPDDAELVAILHAKGIPFQVPAACTGSDCTATAPLVHTLPEVEFRTNTISTARREELKSLIQQVLARELESLRAQVPELRLQRIVISETMKLELYFNREFARIADDETQLSDFSERLHDLGNTELRGSNFFIEGQPLGLYLKTRDAERNKEAGASVKGGGEAVR